MQSLTNVQLELLKTFSFNLNNEDLKELKGIIADYFAKKAINSANESWDKNKWDDKKVDEILNTKLRKSK